MPKPCDHGGFTQEGCRVCFLAATRPDYADLWGETVPPGSLLVPRGSTACNFRGGVTGEVVDCPGCQGNVRLKVYACERHGPCTLERRHPELQCCADCPDHTARRPQPAPLAEGGALPPAGDLRRNLLYHIYPMSGNGAWQRNVDRLKRSLHLFNGKVVVAVAIDPPGGRRPDPTGPHSPSGGRHLHPCDSMATVQGRFEPWTHSVEFVEIENDPQLREVKTFLSLFSRVASTDPCEVTLCAHAKGVTQPANHPTAHRWTEILYEVFLDHWPLVEGHLRAYPVTGAFQKMGPGWNQSQSNSDWHYSGSWFAFRNRDLFLKPNWHKIDQFWSGIEPYPSQHFSHQDAGCLFHRGKVPGVNLYDGEYLRTVVEPALARWKAQNQSWRTPDAP